MTPALSSRSPISASPRPLQWSAAVGVAVAVHLMLAFGFAGYSRDGAVGEGQGGVEIGLGLLGDAGESAISTDSGGSPGESPEAESPAPTPEPAPAAEATPAPSRPTPPAAPVSVPSRTIEIQQTAEVVPSETINPAVAPEQTVDDVAAPESPAPASPDDALGPTGAALATDAAQAAPSGTANALQGVQGSGEDANSGRRRSSGAGDSPSAGGTPGQQAGYAARLAARLNRYKHYPMAARRARMEGTATLFLRVRRDGSVAEYRISESSGFEALDSAVLRMLDRAQPLPAFPAVMPDDEVSVSIPVSFSLSRL